MSVRVRNNDVAREESCVDTGSTTVKLLLPLGGSAKYTSSSWKRSVLRLDGARSPPPPPPPLNGHSERRLVATRLASSTFLILLAEVLGYQLFSQGRRRRLCVLCAHLQERTMAVRLRFLHGLEAKAA